MKSWTQSRCERVVALVSIFEVIRIRDVICKYIGPDVEQFLFVYKQYVYGSQAFWWSMMSSAAIQQSQVRRVALRSQLPGQTKSCHCFRCYYCSISLAQVPVRHMKSPTTKTEQIQFSFVIRSLKENLRR